MKRFLTNSPQVRQIAKGLKLSRPLLVSSIVIGEPHTGKKTLVYDLFPQIPTVSGTEKDKLLHLLDEEETLIITSFEAVNYFDRLDFSNKRIIAVADGRVNMKEIDKLFAFIYTMPPLRERAEDIELLSRLFVKEAKERLMLEGTFDIDYSKIDLSQNVKSLRSSIYRQALYTDFSKEQIEGFLYNYFLRCCDDDYRYKRLLALFERPLLEAGLKRFGSQLQLAKALDINRNTLRKKIHEHAVE